MTFYPAGFVEMQADRSISVFKIGHHYLGFQIEPTQFTLKPKEEADRARGSK